MRIVALLVLSILSSLAYSSNAIQTVSFFDLVLNGKNCNGCRIEVFGYYSFDDGLYLTSDHAKHFDKTSSVQVVFRDENHQKNFIECKSKYVSVVGTIFIDKSNFMTLGDIEAMYKTNGSCQKAK